MPAQEQSPPNTPANDPARKQLKAIFEYLRALEEQKYATPLHIAQQPQSFPLTNLPAHRTVQCFRPGIPEDGEITYLRVAKPQFTPAPKPPSILENWLAPEWQNWPVPLALLKTRPATKPDGFIIEELFESSPERVSSFEQYRDVRNAWIEAERAGREAHDLYERLYKIHGSLDRESEKFELVLGNAVLACARPNADIQHPLLLAPVQLVFEASKPEFRIIDSDAPVEFYEPPFSKVHEWTHLQNRLKTQFTASPVHPFDSPDEVRAWAKTIAHTLDENGSIAESFPNPASDVPRLVEQPFLFLRSRAEGMTRALDAIVRDLESSDAPLPAALKRLAGLDHADQTIVDEHAASANTKAVDPLFCLPSNPQQLQALEALAHNPGVIVQGPPGTGKTHTIANIIGHYLAHGKSVLVTSNTEKALNVLREKIP